jgi:hypothetical protein
MITVQRLLDLGFVKMVSDGHNYYELNKYILIPVLGDFWLISSNFDKILTTGDFPVIQTVDELKRHYLESIGMNLQ